MQAELRRHSKARTPVAKISKQMKRTVGALRQQAFQLGIGLGHQRYSLEGGMHGSEVCLQRHPCGIEGVAGRLGAPSHSMSLDQRRRPETFFTAMAMAFFCPTRTT